MSGEKYCVPGFLPDLRTMSLIVALIAATAEVHDLTLVTRKTRDFEKWSGPVFNPWAATDV